MARTEPGERGDFGDGGALGGHGRQRLAPLAPDGLHERLVEDLVLGEFEIPAQRIGFGQVISTLDLQQSLHLGGLGLETGGGRIGHGAPLTPPNTEYAWLGEGRRNQLKAAIPVRAWPITSWWISEVPS